MQRAEVSAVHEVMHWTIRPAPLALGTVTVEVHGTPVPDALWRLADDIEQHTSTGTAVILDLDGLVLTSSTAMRGFIAHLNARGIGSHTVLQCNRSTGRQLLRRWAGGSMPVVRGVERVTGIEPAL